MSKTPAPKGNNYSDVVNAAIGPKSITIEDPFDRADDAREKTNPNYYDSWEFRENCQRVVAAFEMRMRGYDVEALPTFKGDMMPYSFETDYMKSSGIYGGKKSWTNMFKGMEPSFIGSRSAKTAENNIIDKMREWGDGSRAILRVRWKGRKSGHVVNVLNIGGDVIVVDAQNASGPSVGRLMMRSMPTKATLWRVDDKEPSDMVAQAMKQRGK